jgi:BirA family biotin operon repressor/biotin-[acetyl-CoA-carboxylase] ligase
LKQQSSSQSNITQAEVLKVLMGTRGQKATLAEICKSTGLSKKDSKWAIKELRSSGIHIDSRKGYEITGFPDSIPAPLFLSKLKSRVIGREVYSYKTIGSTNETARRMAESGAPEGTIILSERQTKGRGRLGRSWHSPAGLGLYFSLILRPRIPFDKVPALSLVAALSVCRVTDRLAGLSSMIKWPNDCFIGTRKTAGILVEVSAELDRLCYAILGVGVNINQREKDFPSELKSIATSIAIEAGRTIDRVGFLQKLIYEFEKSYNNFTRYGLRFIGPELVERSTVINRDITVRVGKKKISGRAIGLDQNGALRMLTEDGVRTISAGEVTLRG